MKPSKRRERRTTREHAGMRSPKKSVSPMWDSEIADLFGYFEAKSARREAWELLALVKPSGATLSQHAAEDLPGWSDIIHRAANENHKQFFIDLGKLLELKRKPNLWTKKDLDTAFILCFDPKISDRDA